MQRTHVWFDTPQDLIVSPENYGQLVPSIQEESIKYCFLLTETLRRASVSLSKIARQHKGLVDTKLPL
jgi:hypothetical protein